MKPTRSGSRAGVRAPRGDRALPPAETPAALPKLKTRSLLWLRAILGTRNRPPRGRRYAH